MNLRAFSLLVILHSLVFAGVVHAQADHLKSFPTLTLNGGTDEAFKNSTTTKELYNKYLAFARMVKTGDVAAQKRIIQTNLEKDLLYWKAEANRPFTAPKAPKTNDKKALAAHEAKAAKAEAADAKKKSTAQAYVTWLSEDVPAWLKAVE